MKNLAKNLVKNIAKNMMKIFVKNLETLGNMGSVEILGI